MTNINSYTKIVLEHFKNPHNYGKLKNPSSTGEVGNIVCGDVMFLYLKIVKNKKNKDIIEDVKFETYGCAAAIATSSVITDLAKGKTIDAALKITKDHVIKTLLGLPPIKIHCGKNEQHISFDVAYETWQYFNATLDKRFLIDKGAEIILETARFWESRLIRNEQTGKYGINCVIGPDEFHEGSGQKDEDEGGVNNNTFTNAGAKWNMLKAIEIINGLTAKEKEKVLNKIGMNTNDYEHWARKTREKAENIFINYDQKTGLFEQFDGYFGLIDPLDPKHYHKYYNEKGEFYTTAMDTYIREEYKEQIHNTQINKQADVLMMLNLFYQSGDLDLILPKGLSDKEQVDIIRKNYKYYAKRTSHGSTLSRSVHAIVGSIIKDKEASDFNMEKSFDVVYGNENGVPTAALGGAWQVAILGRAGVKINKNGISFSPNLPSYWKKIKFNIMYRGQILEIEETDDKIKVKVNSNNGSTTIPVKIGEKIESLNTGDSKEYSY